MSEKNSWSLVGLPTGQQAHKAKNIKHNKQQERSTNERHENKKSEPEADETGGRKMVRCPNIRFLNFACDMILD